MKLLLTIVLIGIAIAVLGPVIAAAVGFAVMIGCTLLWFVPFVLILFSDPRQAAEKFGWILLMIFFSWFAWIFYFLFAPIGRPRDRYEHRREYRDRHYRALGRYVGKPR